jgi:hypothetical protein
MSDEKLRRKFGKAARYMVSPTAIWANHRCRLSCCSWRKLALSGTGDIRRSQPETKTVLSVSDDSKNVVRKVDDRYGRAGASGCLQEGAPGRAARSPATAAVLILFAQNRKGVPTAAKTEWPSTQRDRRKTRAENQGYYRP